MVDLVAELYERAIPKYCQGRLLDLGCGHAPLYMRYKDCVSDVTCVDWAESLHQNRLLDVIHDLNEPFPLDDNTFDCVICSDVLEHIYKPTNVWNETYRIMKPGGVLLLNVPFYYWIHEMPHDYHRYTKFSLDRYATDAGFDDVKVMSVGGKGHVLADVIGRSLKKVPGSKYWVRFLHQLVASSPQKTLAAAMSNSTTNRWPYLYFVVAHKKKNTTR